MAKVKTRVCLHCEAEFKIKFDMDERKYLISYCPFCGNEIEAESDLPVFESDD